ncbi:alpha/beta hydrolase [soil metagenome]
MTITAPAARWQREDIEFTADGTTLRGWLYRPAPFTDGPRPALLLSHGFSALKEQSLDRYAEVFCAAGFICLVYDHRNLGASDGEPRGEIDPWRQVLDMRHALSVLRNVQGVDRERIGLWGTSYSGGHALVVAALDRRVKCVVAQVMTIDGGEAGRRRMPGPALAAFRERINTDLERRALGLPPERVPVAEAGSGSMKYLIESFPAVKHPNSITLLSRELAMGYRPGLWIEQIAPTPLLMIVAGADELTPVDLQLAAYERAGQPKKLVTIEGATHYAPYIERFNDSSAAALDWFSQHLLA